MDTSDFDRMVLQSLVSTGFTFTFCRQTDNNRVIIPSLTSSGVPAILTTFYCCIQENIIYENVLSDNGEIFGEIMQLWFPIHIPVKLTPGSPLKRPNLTIFHDTHS